MKVSYRSDRGLLRADNEDSIVCLQLYFESHSTPMELGLFAAADGMGGYAGGKIASDFIARLFVGGCCFLLLNPENQPAALESPEDILRVVLCHANRKLFQKAKETGLQGMGTTITAALILGQNLHVINVGDSRCYIINDREIIQVTRDHSVVQDLVAAGLIRPEEARHHYHKNVLTRVVGRQEEIEPDTFQRRLYQGDNVLLCTDGLWSLVSDQQMAEIVLGAETLDEACVELVSQANRMGGTDNISVILVKPDHLPSWQESLALETQVIKTS